MTGYFWNSLKYNKWFKVSFHMTVANIFQTFKYASLMKGNVYFRFWEIHNGRTCSNCPTLLWKWALEKKVHRASREYVGAYGLEVRTNWSVYNVKWKRTSACSARSFGWKNWQSSWKCTRRTRHEHLGLSYSTMQQFTNDLHLHAYKIKLIQELKSQRPQQLRVFVEWMREVKVWRRKYC